MTDEQIAQYNGPDEVAVPISEISKSKERAAVAEEA
jgi:hypothetical protein